MNLRKANKIHFILLFAVLCFGSAYFIEKVPIFQVDVNSVLEKYKTEIEAKIKFEYEKLAQERKKLSAHLIEKKDNNFTVLNEILSFPFFVYRNGQLSYWSNNSIEEVGSPGDKNQRFIIHSPSGIFLASENWVGNTESNFFVQGLLPIMHNYDLKNEYFKNQFNPLIFEEKKISIVKTPQNYSIPITYQDEILFRITVNEEEVLRNGSVVNFYMALIVSGFLLICTYLFYWIFSFHKNQKHLYVLGILAVFLFEVRYFMLSAEIPFKFIELDLFNPINYASSSTNPSLGDLFLNILFIAIFCSYLFFLFLKNIFRNTLKKLNFFWKHTVCVLLILVSFIILYSVFHTLENLHQHSGWSSDITDDSGFDLFRTFYSIIFLLLSIIYFFCNHIILKICSQYEFSFKRFLFIVTIGYMLFVMYIIFDVNINIFLIHCVLLLGSYYFKLHRNFKIFRYETYLYLILTAIATAFTGAMALHQYNSAKEIMNKTKFSDQVVNFNDLQGEFLLDKIGDQIKKDPMIQKILDRPFSSKKKISQKIKKVYIDNYFDKYDVNISIYNVFGQPYGINHIDGNYDEIFAKFNTTDHKTEYNNLLLINNFKKNFYSKYMRFIRVEDEKQVFGYVILDLTRRQSHITSLAPRLFSGGNYFEFIKSYNYAIYNAKDERTFSNGEFNYSQFPTEFLASHIYNGFYYNGFHHLVLRTNHKGEHIVVSSPDKRLYIIFTNFSFLFINLVFLAFMMVLLGAAYQKTGKGGYTFSSKVQLYLNIAFFAPLIIVSLVTFKIITNTFQKDLINSFKGKAELLHENFGDYLNKLLNKTITNDEFSESILNLGKYTQTDINLYDRKGRLLTTSQSLIYETNLLSNRLNPDVVASFFEQGSKIQIIEENIADFRYSAIYMGIVSPKDETLIGVLGIPFYDSISALNEKRNTIFASILNIFTVLFILILFVSFIAFRSLTNPLKLIADNLRKISLTQENTKLEWKSNDEIGRLIHEYNTMIDKLEENKIALSQAEKESAWKEMARQVAHEIKNPLTPMKLKLQFLQRQLMNDEDDRPSKSIESLLVQVDTLSDIATSFSSFATMPIPKNEKFDLIESVKKTIILFDNDKEMELRTKFPDTPLYVMSDEKLFGRIISNLIINGKQAIPSDRSPLLKFAVTVINRDVQIEINDNGEGIPEDIQPKVFIPNFSTKFSGSGIGLAVAKRGIEHAGGQIWFETEVNVGTSFFIRLPLCD